MTKSCQGNKDKGKKTQNIQPNQDISNWLSDSMAALENVHIKHQENTDFQLQDQI